MSSLPESEYPNVLIPSDTLEPLITYDAKTASIQPGVKGTREVCISRTLGQLAMTERKNTCPHLCSHSRI